MALAPRAPTCSARLSAPPAARPLNSVHSFDLLRRVALRFNKIMSKKEKEKLYDQQINREVLIAAIKDRPVLWNTFLEIYKDKTAKTAAWREIYIILKEDFEEMDQKDRQLFGKFLLRKF